MFSFGIEFIFSTRFWWHGKETFLIHTDKLQIEAVFWIAQLKSLGDLEFNRNDRNSYQSRSALKTNLPGSTN